MYDIVGIGFGPSNLALAAATEEQSSPISLLCLEKKTAFSWHEGMLLPDTEMQISFLKDIATLRNPSSPYTFLNYLHEQGRLARFINLKTFYPSRIEYSDYFAWVAKKLAHLVQYQCEVIEVAEAEVLGKQALKVIYQNGITGKKEAVYAKNVVIAAGGTPVYPHFIEQASSMKRVWHTAHHARRIQSFKNQSDAPYHFAVVGRGQSAAEIACDLYHQFPKAKISCIHRSFSYKPADESPFSNEVFDADFVDTFYALSNEMRAQFLDDYSDTNYAVADIELIQKLYKIQYDDAVNGQQRLFYRRFTHLSAAEETSDGVKATLKDGTDESKTYLSLDALVLATGYHFEAYLPLLKSLREKLKWNANGTPKVERYYRLSSSSALSAGIYLQGGNEQTHGLSDTLLSINAIRAHEIVVDILRRRSSEGMEVNGASKQVVNYA